MLCYRIRKSELNVLCISHCRFARERKNKVAVESTLGQRKVNSRRETKVFSLETRKKKRNHHFVEVIAQSGNEENMEIHARQTQRSERDNEKQML